MSGAVTEAARWIVLHTVLAAVIAGVEGTVLMVTLAEFDAVQLPSSAMTVRVTLPAPVGVKFTLVPVAVAGVALVRDQL